VLEFNIYRAQNTYPSATLDPITTFQQWTSFVNTATRDFTYAYDSTTGAQLAKKTPLHTVSITYNNPAVTTYQDIATFTNNLKTLISTQLSGTSLTIDEQFAFWFQYNNTTRQFEIYFHAPKLYLETRSSTTSTLNSVLNILPNGFGGVYLPTQAITQSFKYNISIDEKNYTGSTIATELQTKLTTAAASDTAWLSTTPFLASYDSTLHRITLQSNRLSGGNSVLATDLRIKIDYANSPLDDVIGFKPQAASNPLVGNGLVNLSSPVVYLWCSLCSNVNVNSNGQNHQILSKVQLNVPFGDIVFYRAETDIGRFNLAADGKDITSISLSLRDGRGRPLPNNSTEYTCSLLLYY
jgi:hypothetical protein